ncbi:MAG: hypothetical protein FWG15_04950 [Propionibacteriaceae bacterium]|nr:hypothetical protein [Propionibacteriaceae bacterium]
MIAQVYVDTGVPHLDHPFDYEIPQQWEDKVRPGIRVRVRFARRLLAGIVVGVSDETNQDQLLPLEAVVSEVVVAPKDSITLIRSVADHLAGGFMDVARLAIPPRIARSEKSWEPHPHQSDSLKSTEPYRTSCLDSYPQGTSLRQAIRDGKSPRVSWTLTPTQSVEGNWAIGFASLASDTLASGRSALILVPDAKDCVTMVEALSPWVDSSAVETLSAAQGPQRRYSSFLRALGGQARVVVGTRAAAYVPMDNLGLIAVWDESDPSCEEQHFPYPALRDIVALRVTQQSCGVVFGSFSRSAIIHQWVEKKWLAEVHHTRDQVSYLSAQVRVSGLDDRVLANDEAAGKARLPHDAFTVIRGGLISGPVVVSVPWVGYRRNLTCRSCRQRLVCSCGGGFVESEAGRIACQICARSVEQWSCSCGGTTWWASTIGSTRTAEELAASFKGTEVVCSDSTTPIDFLDDEPRIVIATPGCEPVVDGGYCAGVIMDGAAVLSRPDIRTSEDALRAWLRVISMVKPGRDGGTVLIIGPGEDRTVQATLRLDPRGFAGRELADRQEAGFPPASRMAIFTGDEEGVAWVASQLQEVEYVQSIGPVIEPDEEQWQLIARVPSSRGKDFAILITSIASRRSKSRNKGKLSWRLDPRWLGA